MFQGGLVYIIKCSSEIEGKMSIGFYTYVVSFLFLIFFYLLKIVFATLTDSIIGANVKIPICREIG